MKNIIYMLIGATFVLTACGNNTAQPKEEAIQEDITLAPSITGDKTEGFQLVHEQAHDIVIFENDDLNMTLTQAIHGRSDVRDLVELKFEIENNSSTTYTIHFDEILFDEEAVEGTKINMFGNKVNEDGKTILDVMVSNENDLTFKQTISGKMRIKIEDGEEETIEFNEKIDYQ